MSRLLILSGLVFLAAGLLLLLFAKVAGGFRVPGDIYYHRGNFTFYFPIVTCIIISLVLTVVVNLLWRR